MSLSIDPQSRFGLSESIYNKGQETFGIMKKHFFLDINNLKEEDVLSIQITHDLVGKPWAIADKYYNSPVLDWVVVMFNKPLNPVNWPAAGAVIKIPSRDIVLSNI